MTRQNAPTQSATHRLCQALRVSAPPDWSAAHAAILAGAPVDTPIPTWAGATPLILAATLDGCIAEAGWLLDHGASLETVTSNGTTALVSAVLHSRTDTAALLLEHGADPNARGRNGWTALMVVSLMNDTESRRGLIVMLLDHGADPAVMALDGRTAPEIFMAFGGPELTGYLDEVLASDHRAAARCRLLDRLTTDQRLAWLPRSTVAESAMKTPKTWYRTP